MSFLTSLFSGEGAAAAGEAGTAGAAGSAATGAAGAAATTAPAAATAATTIPSGMAAASGSEAPVIEQSMMSKLGGMADSAKNYLYDASQDTAAGEKPTWGHLAFKLAQQGAGGGSGARPTISPQPTGVGHQNPYGSMPTGAMPARMSVSDLMRLVSLRRGG